MNQTQVCIRPAGEADSPAVRTFLTGLSPLSQYQRFFTGLGSVSPSLVRELVAAGPRKWSALAVQGTTVVGHGMAAVNPCGAVELGLVVADGHRNRGIATRLLGVLLEQAVRAGASELHLDVLSENRLVLDWIRRALPETRFERDGYTIIGHTPLRSIMVATPAA